MCVPLLLYLLLNCYYYSFILFFSFAIIHPLSIRSSLLYFSILIFFLANLFFRFPTIIPLYSLSMFSRSSFSLFSLVSLISRCLLSIIFPSSYFLKYFIKSTSVLSFRLYGGNLPIPTSCYLIPYRPFRVLQIRYVDY